MDLHCTKLCFKEFKYSWSLSIISKVLRRVSSIPNTLSAGKLNRISRNGIGVYNQTANESRKNYCIIKRNHPQINRRLRNLATLEES